MSFFDAIEKLSAEPKQTTRQPETISLPGDHDEELADRQPVEHEAKKKTGAKPEKFAFLGPCSACGNRNFVYDDDGVFSCVACSPGKLGLPAEATGPDRSDSHPDPDERVSKTTCSYETGADQPFFQRKKGCSITAKERESFAAAWPWIRNNMPELLAGGWTRETLLRCSKIRYPMGKWGVAWFPVWKKENLAVEIGMRGEIIFSFQTIRRTVTQSAHPPPRSGRKPEQGNREK